jgi:hypothetical protein
MVWSSAQPHNVNDMMLETFGRDRNKFLAIWARDTLGLTEDHYCASSFSFHNPPLPMVLFHPLFFF